MKPIQIIKRPDLGLQAVIISCITICALGSLYERGILIFSMLGLLFLGIVQLMVAVFRSLILKNKVDRVYLFSALAYCGILYASTFLEGNISYHLKDDIFPLIIAFWAVIPFMAGTWYFIYQVKTDWEKEQSEYV